MATYYFDPSLGNDSNDGLSIANAKASFDVFRANALGTFGDTFALKCGERHVIQSRSIPSGNSTKNPTKLISYGAAHVPYAYVLAGASIGLNISQRSYITFEDLYFDGNGLGRAIYISATASGNSIGHVFRRCSFTKSIGDIPGLYIGKDNTTNVSTNHLVEDCNFFDNDGSGITIMGSQNVIVRRCKAWNNGALAFGGGHGFHTQSRYTISTFSGWTLVSGFLYSRPLASHEVDIYYVKSTPYPRMTKNTSTPTTPALGEFGVSAGTLYINTGASPNSDTIYAVWNVSSNITYEDCISNNNKYGVAAFQEGHGFSFDDWTSDSVIRRCISKDNEGLGFSLNNGDNNLILSSIAQNNWMRGISLGSGINNKVYNCSLFRNNQSRGAANSEISCTSTATGSLVKNTCIIANTTYGIYFDSATSCVAATNAITGVTTPVFGGSESGTITTAPDLTSSLSPKTTSPLKYAGTFLLNTLDAARQQLHNPPSIGAYEYTPSRADAGIRGVR